MNTVLMRVALLLLVLACGPALPADPLTFESTDGAKQTVFDGSDKKPVVLIFITHDCPIANAYAPEIQRIATTYAEQNFRFLLVYVDYDLTNADAKKHAADFRYELPAMVDREHKLVALAGATITPEAAIFSADGKRLYCGRIDNKYADLGKPRAQATVRDLRAALDAITKGEAPKAAAGEAIGCLIPKLRK